MKIILRALLSSLSLLAGACSTQPDPAPAPPQHSVWILAAHIPRSRVPYSPAPIVTARETPTGTWVWTWRRRETPAETLSIDQLLAKLTEVRAYRPEPEVLFTFAQHANGAELIALRARIAGALGCESLHFCIEGTPEQLR